MPTGFDIYSEDDGSVMVSSGLMTYNYRYKGTGQTVASPKLANTAPSSAIINVRSGMSLPLVAIRIPGYAMAVVGYAYGDPLAYGYISTAPPGTSFEYWVFDRAATQGSGKNYGLQLFNEGAGELTFDALMPPMRVVGMLGYSRYGNDGLSGAGSTGSWPGKTLATVQGAFSGHSFPKYREDYYQPANDGGGGGGSSGPVIGDGDNEGDYIYYWQLDAKVYGGRVEPGGAVGIDEISFDDVRVGPERDPTGPPSWSCPLNCLFVVDVTGYT